MVKASSVPTATATVKATLPSSPTATATLRPSPTATLVQVSAVDQLLARCPTAQQVAAINAGLKLTFEADPTAGKLVCTASTGSADLTLLQRRIYQTLQVVKRLEFSQPLPWTTKPLYVWLTDTIKAVRFRSDIELSFCCQPKDTINIKVANNMYHVLTDRWIDPSIGGGLADLVVLLVHEARHNEGRPHTCGANDNTIGELGAWGVQYYLDLWLSDYVDANLFNNPTYPQTMKKHAEDIRKTRFCREP